MAKTFKKLGLYLLVILLFTFSVNSLNTQIYDDFINSSQYYQDGVKVCLANGTNCQASGSVLNFTELEDVNLVYPSSNQKLVYLDGATNETKAFPNPVGVAGWLYSTVAGVITWSPLTSLTWKNILGNGRKTGGDNPEIDTGDALEFQNTVKNITSYTDYDITVNVDGVFDIRGNLSVNETLGYAYLVNANECSFKHSGSKACLNFKGGAQGGYEFLDTVGNVHMYLGAVANNTLYVQGDIKQGSGSALGIGDRSTQGLANGHLNATTIHFTSADNYSPLIMCNVEPDGKKYCKAEILKDHTIYYFITDGDYNLEQGFNLPKDVTDKLDELNKNIVDTRKWKKDREDCIKTEEYTYTDFDQWKKGNRTCTFHIPIANYICKRDYGHIYFYDDKAQGCKISPKLECEKYIWNWYDDIEKDCYTNKAIDCNYNIKNQNNSWNYLNMSCDLDFEKECYNRGKGWLWDKDTKNCYQDPNKMNSDNYEECLELYPKYIWNGLTNTCELAK